MGFHTTDIQMTFIISIFPLTHLCLWTNLSFFILSLMVSHHLKSLLHIFKDASLYQTFVISLDNIKIRPSDSLRDNQLVFFLLYITKLTQSCRFLPHNTRGICPFLSTEATQVLVQSCYLKIGLLAALHPIQLLQMNQIQLKDLFLPSQEGIFGFM